MRRGLLLAGALGAATAGLAGQVKAADGLPPGLANKMPEAFVCDGVDTVVFGGNGRSGWVNGSLYVARSIHFEGTFTPASGGPAESFSFTKTFGRGPSGETVQCVSHEEGSDATGSFVVDGRVTAVRVPGHG